ncbi:MAG: hypothetical protein KAJ51_00405 [Thermoplasmata archaeon]|nr:hypothetical protein [Thermoplasmata archaeon]
MEIKLVVDGQEIVLNRYVESVIYELNNGLLNTLRDLDDWTKFELIIQK